MKAPKDRQDYEFEEKSEKDFEIAEMMERLQNSMGGMGGMGGMGEGTVDTRAGGGGDALEGGRGPGSRGAVRCILLFFPCACAEASCRFWTSSPSPAQR